MLPSNSTGCFHLFLLWCLRCLSSCLKLLVVNKFEYNRNLLQIANVWHWIYCRLIVRMKQEMGLIKQSDHIVLKLICDMPFHNYGFTTMSWQYLYTTSDSPWAALMMFLFYLTQHQFVFVTSFKDLISHFMSMDILPTCLSVLLVLT